MPSDRRREKLNNLIREELSKILDREFEFPSETMLTLTRVDMSPDGHYATVFFTVFGKEKETLDILEKNVYTIQQMLNRRMRVRPVPKIRFAVDEQEINRESIEKSLSNLKKKGEI